MKRERSCSGPAGSDPLLCNSLRSSHTSCTLRGGGCARSMASSSASISACGTVIVAQNACGANAPPSTTL
eukprot:4490319-Prymnesium_polylepis.1